MTSACNMVADGSNFYPKNPLQLPASVQMVKTPQSKMIRIQSVVGHVRDIQTYIISHFSQLCSSFAQPPTQPSSQLSTQPSTWVNRFNFIANFQ